MSEEQIERGQDREEAVAEERTEDKGAPNRAAVEAGASAEANPGAGTKEKVDASAEAKAEANAEVAEKRTFSDLGLGAELTGALAEAGILEPTSVQAGVIPELLAGRDGVLRSPTGSGKTLAYLLPLLQQVDAAKRETQAVVIAPTQELAMQIVRVSEKYGEPLGVKTVALIGGAALSRQLDRMKAKPAIVVGTPGRIREVASLRKLPLQAVRHVVVDETDRVFSLGGKSDVEFVLKGASRDRQTVFVSATRSDTMRAAEAKWLRDPWETTVRQEQEPGLPQTIEHLYLVSDPRDKIDLVRRLVRTLKPASTLLFVNDIERIGELLAKLRFEGFAVDALYGDTPGRERGEVLRKFREGKTKLLVASDVAARGLDVQELALVLQFEPALDADHYVHRAGRTGRMGRSGTSITIVTPKEQFIMDKLGKQLRIEIRERRLARGKLEAVKSDAKREALLPDAGERSQMNGGAGFQSKGAAGARTKGGAGVQAKGAPSVQAKSGGAAQARGMGARAERRLISASRAVRRRRPVRRSRALDTKPEPSIGQAVGREPSRGAAADRSGRSPAKRSGPAASMDANSGRRREPRANRLARRAVGRRARKLPARMRRAPRGGTWQPQARKRPAKAAARQRRPRVRPPRARSSRIGSATAKIKGRPAG